MTTIGVVVFPHVEELDFVGPFEVFGLAARCLKDKAKQNGSLDRLSRASIEEIASLPEIPRPLAERIVKHLKG